MNLAGPPAGATRTAGTSQMDSPGLAASAVRTWETVCAYRKMVGISVAACVGLASAYVAVSRPLYSATARVLVLQRGGHPLIGAKDESVQYQDGAETFLPTQAAILLSPAVVGRAIEDVGPRNLPTLAADRPRGTTAELAQDAVARYLRVTRPDRTAAILLIEYRAGSAAEASRMVSAVVSSYEKFLEDDMAGNNSDVVSLISRARDGLSREMAAAQAEYQEFQRAHPLLLDDEASRTLATSRLVELDRAANEAMTRSLRLRSQLDSGRALAGEGADMWAVAYAMSQLGADPGAALIPRGPDPGGAGDFARRLGVERDELAARFGPDYSKVKDLGEQLAGIAGGTGAAGVRGNAHDVRQLLSSVEQGLKSVETMRAEIARQLEADLGKARKTAGELAEGRGLRDTLERLKALFYTVVEQLKRAQLGGNFSRTYARTIEPTIASDRPVYPRTSLTLLMGLLTGCAAGAVAAVAADGLDQRFRSPEELRAALGLRVLAVVPPEAAGGGADATPGLVCRDRPLSPQAEAYKVARTGLEFARRGRRLQVVLVTSAVAGEGASETAGNLAVALAQAGRKVLLVDADLRAPTLHRRLGLRRETGLVHALKGLLPLHRVVQPTGVPGLDFVAAGSGVVNHSELLMSGGLDEFLEAARPRYDLIVLDSSPLVGVTDASILCALADGVVVSGRASAARRPEVARAVELLKAVGAPVLGAVIRGGDDRPAAAPARAPGRRPFVFTTGARAGGAA